MSDVLAMKYRVLAPVTFHAGALLGLTEVQARARRYALKTAAKGLHEVVTEVQFKAGEELLLQGDLPKPLTASLQLVTGRRGA